MDILQSPGDVKPTLLPILRACMASGMNCYTALNTLQVALDDIKARAEFYLPPPAGELPAAYREELDRVFGACGGEDGDLSARGA
jgi:hypothetical protein